MTSAARDKPEAGTHMTCTDRHSADPGTLEQLQPHLIGPRTVEAVADVFKLLGDPTRVRLVDALTHGERCVCDLAMLVGMTESAVSHQLRLLRAARLVRVRRTGRLAYYSLDDHHVVGLLHDTRKHVEEPHESPSSGFGEPRQSAARAPSPGGGPPSPNFGEPRRSAGGSLPRGGGR